MFKIKEITDKTRWEEFIHSHEQGNFLQSWNWGKFNQQIGNKIFRCGLVENNRLQGVFVLIKKTAKRGDYLECPAGPLFNKDFNSCLPYFKSKLQQLAAEEDCIFARVRPQLLANPRNKHIFKSKGFFAAPMHLHAENTWQLKLDKEPDELLSNMRKSRRYEIRKAERDGVEIKKTLDSAEIEELYQLQLKTAERQNFVPFSKEYMQEQFKIFAADQQTELYKAFCQGNLLAISMFIFYNREAVYHYSATASKMRSVPASQRILWEAILEAKKRGHDYFNFWGIAPKDKEDDHRFSGVTFFKKGFGGHRVDYLHARDLPFSWRYWPVYLFETFRKWKRGL